MSFWQETRPEDRVRDAFCYAVMLQLKKRHMYTSIDGDWLLAKMKVFYSLLEFECKEVKDFFYDMDDLKRSVLLALIRARNEREMFTKSGISNRFHFEPSFDSFAEKEISTHLSQNFQSALNKIMDEAILISLSTQDWEEAQKRIALYKTSKGFNRGH